MENTTLKFEKSFTIPQIKDLGKADRVDVIKNPKTDKLFFVAGSISGKVSGKGYKDNPTISWCVDSTTKEEFYILHSKGSDNVVDSL